MSLTAKDVAAITQILEESDFDELHLELEGIKLSLRRSGAPAAGSAGPAVPSRAESPMADRVASAPSPAAPPTAADPSHHVVAAPLLGTFYRAPKPGASPFVTIGSDVTPDTVVCIIEVMKLMNTVRAGVQGRVAEVVATDGTLVEYGEALLRIAPGA